MARLAVSLSLWVWLCCVCGCAGPTRIVAGDSSAVRKLKHDCARDSKACVDLGLVYYGGTEVPQNLGWAQDLFDEACRNGIASGCNDLGNMYLAGKGVERDVERARNLIDTACRAGDLVACKTLTLIPAPAD